jgi:outer membrane protein
MGEPPQRRAAQFPPCRATGAGNFDSRGPALWVLAQLLLSLGAGSQPALAQDAAALTLPAAIDQALLQNPKQLAQRLDTDRSERQLQAARGAYWPAIDFGAGVTHYGYPTFVYPVHSLTSFPPFDQTIYNYGVALRLPIYAGGRLSQAVVGADLGKTVARERERLSVQELTYDVSTVYLKVEHLAALEQAYDARIASLEAQEKRVTLLLQVGKAARLDYLKIHGALTKGRHDRLEIDNRRREAYTLFYQLLGMAAPARDVPLVHYVAATAPEWSLEALQRQALAQRPELRINERQVAIGTSRERIARGERLPTLSVVGSVQELAGTDLQFTNEWNVGLQLTVPLVDGGVRRAHEEDAAIARQQAEYTLDQTRLEVMRQVQDAWDALNEAGSRLVVTQTSIAEATEALAIEKLKYEQGVGITTDLLNAESALLVAEADRLQAQFDLITARLNILRVTGELNPQGVGSLIQPVAKNETEIPSR